MWIRAHISERWGWMKALAVCRDESCRILEYSRRPLHLSEERLVPAADHSPDPSLNTRLMKLADPPEVKASRRTLSIAPDTPEVFSSESADTDYGLLYVIWITVIPAATWVCCQKPLQLKNYITHNPQDRPTNQRRRCYHGNEIASKWAQPLPYIIMNNYILIFCNKHQKYCFSIALV